ncbi:MAG: hypothetical protein H8E10_05120 [Desulfobacterales bacterium]|nr:hypothetical protein [Desulfobacterales bacterium]
MPLFGTDHNIPLPRGFRLKPIERIPENILEAFAREASFEPYLQGKEPEEVTLTQEDLDYDRRWTQNATVKYGVFNRERLVGFVAGGTMRQRFNPYDPADPRSSEVPKTSLQHGLFDINAVYVHPGSRGMGMMDVMLNRILFEARAGGRYQGAIMRNALYGPLAWEDKKFAECAKTRKGLKTWTYDPVGRRWKIVYGGSGGIHARTTKEIRLSRGIIVPGGLMEGISGGQYTLRGLPFYDGSGHPNYIRHIILRWNQPVPMCIFRR